MKSEKVLNESSLICSYCDKSFKYDSERKRHEKSHTPHFKCQVCSKVFGFLSALRRHEKQHSRAGTAECDKCNKHFQDELLLKRHIKYAHKGSFSCEKCSTSFSSETALSTHMNSHKKVSERKYKCTHKDCSRAFNSSQHLKYHQLTHTNTKMYYCNICAKGFIQHHHFKAHILTHEPEKWLPCLVEGCNKKFPTEYTRKRHLRTHTNKSLESTLEFGSTDLLKKDTIFCASCGLLIARLKYPKHCLICEDLDRYNDHSMLSITNNNEANPSLNNKLPTKVNDDKVEGQFDINFDEYSCKSAIGKCIMGESEQNENCLCAQMKYAGTRDYDFDEPKAAVDKVISCEDFKENFKEDKDACIDCHCALDLTSKKMKKEHTRLNCCDTMPKITYGGGVVKIQEYFDESINLTSGKKTGCKEKTNMEMDKVGNTGVALYNSCQDVLGKCLVSEDGSMSEGCLCAKMSNEIGSLDTQEVDEITPNPNVI